MVNPTTALLLDVVAATKMKIVFVAKVLVKVGHFLVEMYHVFQTQVQIHAQHVKSNKCQLRHRCRQRQLLRYSVVPLLMLGVATRVVFLLRFHLTSPVGGGVVVGVILSPIKTIIQYVNTMQMAHVIVG
jgi:hypothetical protein